MALSSQELASTMDQVSQGATSQASDLQDIVEFMDNLSTKIESVYSELENVKNEATIAIQKANNGSLEMDKLVASINGIKSVFENVNQKVNALTDSVEKINNMTEIINSISEQTNLLALNASIEAARAGEAGKGFGVVAQEVKKLAEASKKSTVEITELVNSIQLDTKEVIKASSEVEKFISDQTSVVENTVFAFIDILDAIQKVGPCVDNTYDQMNEMKQAKQRAISKVEDVSAVIEENTAASQEVAASSSELSTSSDEVAKTAQNLSSMAKDLVNIVNEFKVD
ncbi:Methyl-accepting chemotaxis protein (MCP) signalling domain-containing protein [Alkalithermobacter thermoalcaliphilus JW-YL-7 = DSM 7308]|uniref:Methyl-accepting chemotaxis protein (MCP) signalling domain-containing protein n=2 Tax=Clostridium paradoxum TaxID=29346 RepID=A0A150FSZ2_CLOPD|nr:methyl-accepting chemotaxis sensory transducer [[Clostridium] paradoxum JW-YL-7 = DSM 7308]SHL33803.1 Methyl-accepting chemotaxis protein (MCP) signalling domain-containing protein [[Clostridium] paradoxum JW-YL-7 = DSM 7308]